MFKEFFMKNVFKQIGAIVLVAIIGFFFAACSSNDDDDDKRPEVFTVKNKTGDYLLTIHLKEPGTLIWSSDSYVGLSNGSATSVTISKDRMDNQYRTDIQLRTSNGNLYTKLSQKLTHKGTVTFTGSDLDGVSPRTVAIGNATGDYLLTIHLKEPGTLIWSSDSYVGLSNGSATSVTISDDRMDSQYRTDIQLRTSNGNLYTKLSQPITHNGNITFISSDLDSVSPRTVAIGNATGDYLLTIHLREPGTLIWSSGSYVGLSNGSATSVTIPNDQMDSQYRTDIQLRTSGGLNYTKLSQPITHNGNVTFTSSDKD
jgi:ribosome-associated translation inhibitor RaiA